MVAAQQALCLLFGRQLGSSFLQHGHLDRLTRLIACPVQSSLEYRRTQCLGVCRAQWRLGDVLPAFQLWQDVWCQISRLRCEIAHVIDESLNCIVDPLERWGALGKVVLGADRLVPPVQLSGYRIEQVAHLVTGWQVHIAGAVGCTGQGAANGAAETNIGVRTVEVAVVPVG